MGDFVPPIFTKMVISSTADFHGESFNYFVTAFTLEKGGNVSIFTIYASFSLGKKNGEELMCMHLIFRFRYRS